MPVDRALLNQVLRYPRDRDVKRSPIVTAILLRDPANAVDLVPYLDRLDTIESLNARRVLCQFEAVAAPHIARALQNAGINARHQGIEVIWAVVSGDHVFAKRDAIAAMLPELGAMLDDRRPAPDRLPDYVERDVRGRICDFTYIMLRHLMDREWDQSEFRSLSFEERDAEIGRLRRRGIA